MRLTDLSQGEWKEKGYRLPQYDRQKVKEATAKNPTWVHFGAGNIFRAFVAEELQELLDKGKYGTGLVVCEAFDLEIIEKAYRPYDGMSLSVILKADGGIEKHVVGSVVESLVADHSTAEDYNRLERIFANPSLQMASFTITEKGYALRDDEEGFLVGPGRQTNVMGKVAELLYTRYREGGHPIAMVSMDNCSHNGDKLRASILAFANRWSDAGLVEEGFVAYLSDEAKVSYPLTMIDKITPRPDDAVKAMLVQDGFEDVELIVTSKNTYTAPFVNSEETGYLVIEDAFPNGRPPLHDTKLLFTDRETVDKVEKMKVCTCLNPLHTALAVFGCLLSHQTIHEEMEDEGLRELVKRIGYVEGMPVVVNPDILNPKDFLDAVVELRLPNPFMPDSPWRIATDTSQKIPIRFGETVKAYVEREDLDVNDLTYIPLAIAAWCRYLMGVNDAGEAYEPSPDPLLPHLTECLTDVALGSGEAQVERALRPILSDKSIFAVDLYEVGLADKVKQAFLSMVAGKGAVRKTLDAFVARKE